MPCETNVPEGKVRRVPVAETPRRSPDAATGDDFTSGDPAPYASLCASVSAIDLQFSPLPSMGERMKTHDARPGTLDADTIGVGAGVFGAWTAASLRTAGERVMLIDAW